MRVLSVSILLILTSKGIYRVNGAKSRVEKLCQAFENGKDLVELSDLYPHDISNVLKLYLRQVGCCLFTMLVCPQDLCFCYGSCLSWRVHLGNSTKYYRCTNVLMRHAYRYADRHAERQHAQSK